jgi:ornithine cyclodeaminase/alanine dehydrogenase
MDAPNELLYLSRSDVESLNIQPREIIEVVEEAFREKAAGRVEMPPKPGIHPQTDSFIHAMPACMHKIRAAGIKWVSGFPNNPEKGLPYVSGVLVLNNFETGLPISVMDCTWITAKRTGAATAIAAKHLARKNSEVLGILGCGVQGRSNLEALKEVFKQLKTVKAYDIHNRALNLFVNEMTSKHRIPVLPMKSPKEAVEDSDIIITAGPILKHPKPAIESSWFKSGSFACPLDFDSYWKPEAIQEVDKFCTDDREQLFYYRKQGYFTKIPKIYADLGELVAGEKPGRESYEERTMSMNLGLSIEDISTAMLIYTKAKARNVGKTLVL